MIPNGQAFKSFGKILGEISDRLSERKGSPLKSYLVNDGAWVTGRFKARAQKGEEGLCQSCNTYGHI